MYVLISKRLNLSRFDVSAVSPAVRTAPFLSSGRIEHPVYKPRSRSPTSITPRCDRDSDSGSGRAAASGDSEGGIARPSWLGPAAAAELPAVQVTVGAVTVTQAPSPSLSLSRHDLRCSHAGGDSRPA